jgi:HTH-type transcriptional regulator, global nitrogen regulator NrpRI
MGWETQDVDRKVLAILKVLSDSPKSMGSKVIARRLKEQGVELSERTIRYHLNLMDERGLTHLIGAREGRILTEQGFNEVKSALVKDKVGFAISKIELLAFRTTFNPHDRTGYIPVNISLFAKEEFGKAVKIMKPVFSRGLCVSRLVSVVNEGEKIGDLVIPEGKVGLATVCSIIVNGTLLKAGVPINSKFGGLLQLRNHQPLRFVELIHYDGSSIDPSEVFIRAGMTSVIDSAKNGEGTILANYREIPAVCRTITEEVITRLKEIEIGGVLIVGNTSESVCQIPIELNRIGIILVGGLNPVAAAKEAGINSENHAMSTVVEYKDLTLFDNL